jgi:hypothetical protein
MNSLKTFALEQYTEDEISNALARNLQVIADGKGIKPQTSKFWKAVENKNKLQFELAKRERLEEGKLKLRG